MRKRDQFKLTHRGSGILMLCMMLLGITAVQAQVVMPLDEVQVGMEGTWDTVIEGDKLQTFRLRVLGVAHNFAGPRQSVIICEAIDPDQILSGPVAGMSGSPVYINGKLVGAYAYGFSWPREQTIIGVTPIENMIEILENYPPQTLSERYRRATAAGAAHAVQGQMLRQSAADSVMRHLSTHQKSGASEIIEAKFPVYVSGISPAVMDAFRPQLEAAGIHWSHIPTASTASGASGWTEEQSQNLGPGMPVAGVLMGGDFNVTGVGTVTWKKGDQLLAFGHPFFGVGAVEIPMAAARVLTVVRSVRQSFKLSEVGPVVGSIYQDRLTGIAGEIGRQAPTIDVSYTVSGSHGETQEFNAQIFEHKSLTPLLAAIGLLQSLQQNLDASGEQTLYLTTEIEIEGHPNVSYTNAAVDSSGALQLAVQLLNVMGVLVDNPFEFPRIRAIRCDVRMEPVNHFSFFDEVGITSRVPQPAETLDVAIRIRNHLGLPEVYDLQIPIPIGTSQQVLTLQIADALQVEPENNALFRPDMTSLGDIIRQINRIRSRQFIYIRLLRQAEGFQLRGDTMYDLPPSIAHLFKSPKNAQYGTQTNEIALWETKLETTGVFAGSYRLNVEIR